MLIYLDIRVQSHFSLFIDIKNNNKTVIVAILSTKNKTKLSINICEERLSVILSFCHSYLFLSCMWAKWVETLVGGGDRP